MQTAPADIVLRPADAYVAEFVQHMNPLSVLTGRMFMRHWGDLEHDTGQTLARRGAATCRPGRQRRATHQRALQWPHAGAA